MANAQALFAGVSPITQVLMDNTGQRMRVTTNLFGADRDAVRVLVLALPFLASGDLQVTISDIRMGGRKMMDVSAEYPQVEYAVAYYNSVTEDLSEPARVGISLATKSVTQNSQPPVYRCATVVMSPPAAIT